MDRRASLVAGVRDVAPFTVGIAPFALVAEAAVVAAGLPPELAPALSVVVFAGASQLAAIELLARGTPGVVIVATVLVINLRLMMYSASVAPFFERLSLTERVPLAYILTDQAFALSVTRFEGESPVARVPYYLGVALPLWVVWQVGTLVGVVAGASVPPSIPIDFAVPLTFLALLVPAIKGRATGSAAAVGGGVALGVTALPVVAPGLPGVGAVSTLNLGLPLGAVLGIVAGVLAQRRFGVDVAVGGGHD